MNRDLQIKLDRYIAEEKPLITIRTGDLAELLAVQDMPFDALARLVAAARAVANLGSVDEEEYRTAKETGLELRAALNAYDRARNPFALRIVSDETAEDKQVDPSFKV